MEVIVESFREFHFIAFVMFFSLSLKLCIENVDILSEHKDNFPIVKKLACFSFASLLIYQMPTIIQILFDSLFKEEPSEIVQEPLSSLGEFLNMATVGILHGFYLILLILSFVSFFRLTKSLTEHITYFKLLKRFESMSSSEALDWCWKKVQDPNGGIIHFKIAQKAILETHPDLKNEILFKTDPENVRYIQPSN